MLALIPLVVMFSKTEDEEHKRQSGVDKAEGVEKVNYEEVANGLDSLITIVKDIDINSDARMLTRTLIKLDSFRDDYTIKDNKKLTKILRTLAGEIYGLAKQYEDSTEDKEKLTERSLKSMENQISDLKDEIAEKKLALQSCRNSLGN